MELGKKYSKIAQKKFKFKPEKNSNPKKKIKHRSARTHEASGCDGDECGWCGSRGFSKEDRRKRAIGLGLEAVPWEEDD